MTGWIKRVEVAGSNDHPSQPQLDMLLECLVLLALALASVKCLYQRHTVLYILTLKT